MGLRLLPAYRYLLSKNNSAFSRVNQTNTDNGVLLGGSCRTHEQMNLCITDYL
uniref:Uncharacterized protein n=1 Tax=Anguilla anguilla TaxID=7936 RepID=A0A0E9RRJ9_ANGAN